MSIEARQPHILIIDSAPAILELLRELFEGEGFRVSTRSVVPSRLEEVKELQPSLIIFDHLRQGETGWSLLCSLQRDADMRAVPVVLCTGAMREVEERADHLVAAGVAVVRKPFDIDELMTVVENARLRRPPRTQGAMTAPAPRGRRAAGAFGR